MMNLQPGPSHRFTLSQATSELLSRHSHLNLTDEVELVDSVIRGHGGFSDVYCGRFIRTGKYVAIKQLRVHIQKEQQLSKNISRELRIWSSLNHPNVLPLLGYTLRAGTSFAFIGDWIENGNLWDYLLVNPEMDNFKVVADIAAGLQYLHEQGVIHSDIKSDNVLISSTGVPMLSDFGVSRVIAASNITTGTSAGCSTRWMAYELFPPLDEVPQLDGTSYRRPVTANEKTDVWAFGMTVYEILTRGRPFGHLRSDAHVIHAITHNRLPPAPEALDTRPFLDQILWKLCKACWTKPPSLRPSMSFLSHAIKCEVKPPVDGIKTKQNGVQHFESYLATSADHPDQESQTILDWLSPLDFELTQAKLSLEWQDGSGSWFLGSKQFKAWRDGTSDVLWCPGIPGAGKTVLASIIIRHLQTVFRAKNVAVLFIFCNYKESAKQTIPHLLASLLRQISQHCDAVSEHIRSLYREHVDRRGPSLDNVRATLTSAIGTYSKVFVIVDALDECPGDGTRESLLKELRGLALSVRLLVTSRDLPSIAQHFHEAKRLDIFADHRDVQEYVKGRIGRATSRAVTALQECVITKVAEKARGMFLLARLHTDSLVVLPNRAAVLSALERFPTEIHRAYDIIMERIKQQGQSDESLAKNVLLWLTQTRRPLSIAELQHALAVLPGMKQMNADYVIDEDVLISVCDGLVVIDKEQSIVRFFHYTAKQYFEHRRALLFPDSEEAITRTCLTYLAFDAFRNSPCRSYSELATLAKGNALLDYSARHWGDHAREAEEKCKDVILDFLQDDLRVACASQVLLTNPKNLHNPWDHYRVPKHFTGLHTASFFGLREAVDFLLSRGDVEVNTEDEDSVTPLSLAARHGHDAVVQLFLARGDVKVNTQDKSGATPLSQVARNGHDAVMRLLLARDNVAVNTEDQDDATPLSLAAGNGHDAVVQLLLARGDVKVNTKRGDGATPLSLAAGNGHDGVAQLLLARGDVKVNMREGWGGATPLSQAARNGHNVIVRLLLARDDVEVNLREEWGGATPLSLAARHGHDAVVQLLLARSDVKVNTMDDAGVTPLSLAAGRGHDATVRLLLARGDIKVNMREGWGGATPLSQAARNGHDAVVQLLLARDDAEVNTKDKDGATPLSLAARHGHYGVVRLLLAQGDIEVNMREGWGSATPLSLAARNAHDAVVQPLLARSDVKVRTMDHAGAMPLSLATERGQDSTVRLPQARGDNMREGWGGATPLSLAARNGHDAVVGLLLARDDIEVNAKDRVGATPLSLATRNGHDAVVRLLLARDDVYKG